MKKIISIVLGVACLFLLAACAPQRTLHKKVDPSWTAAPSNVTVYVLDTKIQNGTDFSSALPNYAGKFTDWFIPLLTTEFKTQSKMDMIVEPVVSKAGHFTREKKAFKHDMDFVVSRPTAKQLGETKGTVITISGLTFNRHVRVKRYNGDKIYYYGVQVYANYSIYSVDNKKELAYGRLDVLEESEDYTPKEAIWAKVTNQLVSDILADTPFNK